MGQPVARDKGWAGPRGGMGPGSGRMSTKEKELSKKLQIGKSQNGEKENG